MEVLRPHNPLHVIKDTRSTFKGNQDLAAYFKERGIEEVHLVGTETHDCVLATAYDAFAAGFPVYALEECIESGTPGDKVLLPLPSKQKNKIGRRLLV